MRNRFEACWEGLLCGFGRIGDAVFALPGMGPVLRRCLGDHGPLFDDEEPLGADGGGDGR
jgi:hypothetical protein